MAPKLWLPWLATIQHILCWSVLAWTPSRRTSGSPLRHQRWGPLPLRSSVSSSLKEEAEDPLVDLPPGIPDGFFITQHYATSLYDEFDLSPLKASDVERLQLSSTNISLPAALMLVDPSNYPSLSKARKACRRGNILIHRGTSAAAAFAPSQEQLSKGRVGDRVYPGDVLCQQTRLSHGAYSNFVSSQPLTFDLPVVYEDDDIAIVNKPAGIVVYEEGGGRNNIKAALPHILKPPPSSRNNDTTVTRPELCHRLDKPTSGLLIIAKTKDAAVHMSRQFEDRTVKKTYTAILTGRLEASSDDSRQVSSQEAFEMGVDVDPNSHEQWYVAENMLDDKHALTLWRVLRYQPSLDAKDFTLTVVELKPKTGRNHQLRRQMAYLYNCPIVGDTTYGGDVPNKRWKRGLFLCSNRVVFPHPNNSEASSRNQSVVSVSIDLPPKFENFLAAEQTKWYYHNLESKSSTPQAF
jgi:RluA family pseudouridine synthase